MEYSFIKQKNEYDCGAAVTCMAINSLQNKNFNLEEFKFDNTIGVTPLSFNNIFKISEKYGLEFKTYSATFEEFISFDIKDPLVVSVLNENSDQHFIVIYKKNKSKYLIADPNQNELQWVNREFLKNIYQNYFGVMYKVNKYKFKTKSLSNWISFLGNTKLKIAFVFIINLILNIVLILTNNFFKVYINLLSKNDPITNKYTFLIFGILFATQIMLMGLSELYIRKIRTKITKNIFNLYKSKLFDLSKESFNSLTKEEWINKISDIGIISNFVVTTVILIPIKLLFLVITSIIITMISPILLLILLLENVFYLVVSYVFYLINKDKEFEIKNKSMEFSVYFRELIDGFDEVKTKNLKFIQNRKIEDKYSDLNNSLERNSKFIGMSSIVKQIISKAFYIGVFIVSIRLISNQEFSIGELIFYSSISVYINDFSNTVGNFIFSIGKVKMSSKNLIFILDKKNKKEIKTISKIKKIKLNNLSKNINESIMLNPISLEINESTFIKGKSGIGKSTMLKIISGLYSDFDGVLKLNDINSNTLNIEDYLSRIIYVDQDSYLFQGTVWENIQNFQNTVSMDVFETYKIFEILENNNIDITRQIATNGSNLSRGQKQIINFISIFFEKKDIYILDESLSNVDKKTANKLLEILIDIKKEDLIIMCDHDLGFQKYFNKVVEV